ncbi:head-to-tail adaptor [Microbacterium phage Barnstormer]|uniref:Head-to-tail adaptor n=1 Tax=Microbacterium phage Barnstormer TaxID=3028491 RepID=A0AAE9ZM27_9CAUD|nr:head-to-tail adaptor [Microbacterium phage Barnstormer]WDS52113.1 head-to-tail adaptor [Microbacterium phage UtzChips]
MPTTLPPSVEELARRIGLEAVDLADPGVTARLTDALEDATTLALAEVSDKLAERWRVNAPAVVRLVILKAARREYENPRGINQETLGEHTVGLSDVSGVYLTAREVAQIERAVSGRKGAYVGSIRTPTAYGVPAVTPTVYTPVSDGSRPVPFLSLPEVL